MAAIEASDHVVVNTHGDDGSSDKGDRHDKSTCQVCTAAAQLIAPPSLRLLMIAAPAQDPYRRVDVERAGLDPPGLNRPPIPAFA